jgi:hypothetical protein
MLGQVVLFVRMLWQNNDCYLDKKVKKIQLEMMT